MHDIIMIIMLVSMTLSLMQDHSGSTEENKSALNYPDNDKHAISITLPATVGYFVHDLDYDFENNYMAGPSCFGYSDCPVERKNIIGPLLALARKGQCNRVFDTTAKKN